ncbi:MAG: hypothetical protein HYY20_05675, partial [Candidatus Tectomicrobia bacterium]|nr:hypothetical protein [Candidatus Tectomicrobia bacterium]
MGRVVSAFLAVIWLAFSALGCAGLKGKEKAVAVGAAAGAAVGATVGAVIGHDGHDSGEGAGV